LPRLHLWTAAYSRLEHAQSHPQIFDVALEAGRPRLGYVRPAAELGYFPLAAAAVFIGG
jgi:hypothetical protein